MQSGKKWPQASKILDAASEGIDKGKIPLKVFCHPEIYEMEMETIFSRCWIFLGHETEIPNAGDYCIRYIGEDQFIWVRDENNKIRAFLNSCRHRGTALCRAEVGNASHFR